MFNVPDWLGVISPFLSGAVGVGLTYGAMRARMEDYHRRLTHIESLISRQVGEARCTMLRGDCRGDLKEDITEIKDELVENRKWLQMKFEELARFIGRMDRAEEARRDHEPKA